MVRDLHTMQIMYYVQFKTNFNYYLVGALNE